MLQITHDIIHVEAIRALTEAIHHFAQDAHGDHLAQSEASSASTAAHRRGPSPGAFRQRGTELSTQAVIFIASEVRVIHGSGRVCGGAAAEPGKGGNRRSTAAKKHPVKDEESTQTDNSKPSSRRYLNSVTCVYEVN